MKSIKTEDIANISGSSVQDVEMQLDKFSASDLNYRFLTEAEEKQTILKVHDQLEQPELAVSGKNDSTRWEVGWEEILQLLKKNRFRPELLRPQYFKYDILRPQKKFIKASSR